MDATPKQIVSIALRAIQRCRSITKESESILFEQWIFSNDCEALCKLYMGKSEIQPLDAINLLRYIQMKDEAVLDFQINIELMNFDITWVKYYENPMLILQEANKGYVDVNTF